MTKPPKPGDINLNPGGFIGAAVGFVVGAFVGVGVNYLIWGIGPDAIAQGAGAGGVAGLMIAALAGNAIWSSRRR